MRPLGILEMNQSYFWIATDLVERQEEHQLSLSALFLACQVYVCFACHRFVSTGKHKEMWHCEYLCMWQYSRTVIHWNLTLKCPWAFHSKQTGSAFHTHNEITPAFCRSLHEALSTCICQLRKSTQKSDLIKFHYQEKDYSQHTS